MSFSGDEEKEKQAQKHIYYSFREGAQKKEKDCWTPQIIEMMKF